MPGWHLSAIALLLSLHAPTAAQSSAAFEMHPLPGHGWVIVSRQTVVGTPIRVGTLGHEIDRTERDAYRLFYGQPEALEPLARQRELPQLLLPFLRPVTEFEAARFYESADGEPLMAIHHVRRGQPHVRVVRLRPSHIRSLGKHLDLDTGYTLVDTESVEIDVYRDRDYVIRRHPVSVYVSGRRLDGELLATSEHDIVHIAMRDGTTHSFDRNAIDRLTIRRSIVGQMAGSTIRYGIQGTMTGATAGLIAGLTLDTASVGSGMKFGAKVGGIVGLGVGILAGAMDARPSSTYDLTPVVQPESTQLFLTMAF